MLCCRSRGALAWVSESQKVSSKARLSRQDKPVAKDCNCSVSSCEEHARCCDRVYLRYETVQSGGTIKALARHACIDAICDIPHVCAAG
ncbi:hypothetical protein IG631_20440 [Alternaria alternata]|nr:hypothetical protein IG631_20440 [Alternaria alternata]